MFITESWHKVWWHPTKMAAFRLILGLWFVGVFGGFPDFSGVFQDFPNYGAGIFV